MSSIRVVCLAPLLMTLGCQFTQDLGGPSRDPIERGGSGGGSTNGGHHAALPLENLQYPKGLWIRDGKVYFTEAASTDTTTDGIARLSVYDIATSTLTTLVDNPVNHDMVAVASDGKIYLGGWTESFPGSHGHVSVVDPDTLVESPVTNLPAAPSDMFIDDQDNIYVAAVGSRFGSDGFYHPDYETTAIYRLPAGRYDHPTRYRQIYTENVTANGDTFYADDFGISRLVAGEPEEKRWVPDDPSFFSPQGLAVYGGDLFYGGTGCWNGYLPGHGECPSKPPGEIRRVSLSTGGAFTTVATGLGEVANVRVDPVTGKLYVLEFGTEAGQYHDGRLFEIDPAP